MERPDAGSRSRGEYVIISPTMTSSLFFLTCYIVLLSCDHTTKYSSFVSAVEYGQIATCPEVPSLHCKNGSTCTPGVASFGSQHDHLALQTHDSGYHCKCSNGYIGHECEILIQECSSTQHVCYNGSECQTNNKSCDCDALNEESESTDTKYSGNMCQHVSTSFCAVTLVGNHAPNHQFCTNHGECVRLVSGGDPHPGCICKDGYTGDHCEVQSDAYGVPQSSSARGNDVSTLSKTMFGVMIVVMIVVTSSVIYFLGSNRRIDKASSRENYDPESSSASPESSELTSNNTTTTTTTETISSLRKTQVGEGELDPDGSGTMMFEIGSPGVITEEDDVSVNSEIVKSNGVTAAGKEIV